QGAGGSRQPCRRNLGIRVGRVHRSGVLRQDLLSGAGQGRRQALCAAHQGAHGNRALRRRPMGDARQRAPSDAAPHRRRACEATEIEVPKQELKSQELTLAKQLIEQQASEKFDASAYVDEVRGRIEAAIQRKVEGQEISVAEAPPAEGAKVIDLMEALRASLK